MRISRKLGLWWARDVESTVLDNVSRFLLFFCTCINFFPKFLLMGCCLGYDQQGMAEIWVQISELRCCSTCNPSTIHLPKQPIGPRNTPALGPFSSCMREQPWLLLRPWLGRAAQWPCVLLLNSLGMAGNITCPPGVLVGGYGEDAKNNSFVDHHHLLSYLHWQVG